MDRLKILVVEDSDGSAAIVVLMIGRVPGWEVVGRTLDAADAEAMAAALRPDVITLDLNLADGDGLDLLGRLVEEVGIPVVVISASVYEGSPVTAEALSRGADSCLDKTRLMAAPDALRRAIGDAAAAARQVRAAPPRSASAGRGASR